MKKEIWKPVAGYEGLYEISSIGRLRSLDHGKSCRKGALILKPIHDERYHQYVLYKNTLRTYFLAHRLVAQHFLPLPLSHQNQVNHINGIKNDNRVENLEWCDASANAKHAYATGLRKSKVGIAHPMSKLNDLEVYRIKTFLARGLSQCFIAKSLKINQSTISDIVRKVTWAHVPDVVG